MIIINPYWGLSLLHEAWWLKIEVVIKVDMLNERVYYASVRSEDAYNEILRFSEFARQQLEDLSRRISELETERKKVSE